MKQYRWVCTYIKDANDTLNNYAAQGYTVHTINRNPKAEIVDILFEKDK